MDAGLAICSALVVLAFALARWLGRWSITMPMLFVGAGLLLGPGGVGLLALSPQTAGVKHLTELTLALLLFADASTIGLRRVRADAGLAARLLALGLPLTLLLGAGLALGLFSAAELSFGLFPAAGLALAALLGAILAPTDAALGLPIFTDPRVPARIRRALNVESGLNDGIVAPIVTLCIALAVAPLAHPEGGWLIGALSELGRGLLVGAAAGVGGGWLLTLATRRGWTAGSSRQIAAFGLALGAFFGALALHGNGFIAAFVGGIAFGAVARHEVAETTEFTETIGVALSLLVWVVFGATLATTALRQPPDWRPIAYALLSLTVVRMAPVALALVGVRLRADTVALMGWFGPRGLASVVFLLLAVIEFEAAGMEVGGLAVVVTWTVLLSILAHGLSARPLAGWYARRLATATEPPRELVEVPEPPSRRDLLAGSPDA